MEISNVSVFVILVLFFQAYGLTFNILFRYFIVLVCKANF